MTERADIIYTKVDEAPELASGSFRPIIRVFTGAAGITVGTRDISLAGRILALFTAVLLTLALTACGSKQPTPKPPAKPKATKSTGKLKGTQRPYTIAGKTYHPMLDARGYREEGVASWYGRDFHGKPTACGERYDMYAMTAAHKILPMHTRLKVTNLENGRQITVRVNDRGPFVKSRVIDLSYEAACRLDMDVQGTAKVRLESIDPLPGFADGDLPGPFLIQVGSFSQRDNAERLAGSLRAQGYRGTRVQRARVGGASYWRVQAGEFKALKSAELELARLALEYPAAFIVAR